MSVKNIETLSALVRKEDPQRRGGDFDRVAMGAARRALRESLRRSEDKMTTPRCAGQVVAEEAVL